jgi:hypothetical protein
MKYSIILKIIPDYAFEVTGVETFTDGINLGNPNFVTLTQPKVAMIVGQGVDPSDAGEMAHMFDQKQLYH